MNSPKASARRNLLLLTFYALVILTAAILAFLYNRAHLSLSNADLINWDEAARSEEAVRLARDLGHLKIGTFIRHLLAINWWPPLFPFVLAVVYLVFGPSYRISLLPSQVAYPLAIAALLFSNRMAGARKPGFGKSWALVAAFGLTSPLLLGASGWVMLEAAGVCLTYFAFGNYFKAREEGRLGLYRWCGLLLFLLWMLKYHFGLFASLTILVFELGRSRKVLRGAGIGRWLIRRLKDPALIVAYVLGLIVLWIAVAGGGKIWLGRLRVSLTNIYNPILFLYVYLLAVTIIRLIKNWASFSSRLEKGQRELLLWGALPTALFMALPDKIKAVLKTYEIGGQVSRGPSFRGIALYTHSFIHDYHLFVPAAVVAIAGAIWALCRIRKTPLAVRALMLYFAIGFVSLSLSYGLIEERFIASFVPALWIIAAWAAGDAFRAIPRLFRTLASVILVIGTIVVAFGTPAVIQKALQQPWAPWARLDDSYRSIIERTVEAASESNSVLLVGVRDLECHLSLSWRLQMSHFKDENFRLVFEPEKFNLVSDFADEASFDLIAIYSVEGSPKATALQFLRDKLGSGGQFALLEERAFIRPRPFLFSLFKKK